MTLPKPEELFTKYNPQDGPLPSWAKELMKEYARLVLEVTQERYYDADGSVTFRSIIDKIKDQL